MFWGEDAKEEQRYRCLMAKLENEYEPLWDTGYSETEQLLIGDAYKRRKMIYKPPVSKKRPKRIYFPTDIETSKIPHWKTAKTILRVNIETGKVLEIDREAIPGLK